MPLRNIRVGGKTDFNPLPLHFAIRDDNPNVVGWEDQHEIPRRGVTLNYERIADMLSHHMGKFEVGGGDLEVDGYKVPMKAAARLYMDAIVTFLGNHGVDTDLAQIRADLCQGCIGSSAPAKEFVQNQVLTPEGVAHG